MIEKHISDIINDFEKLQSDKDKEEFINGLKDNPSKLQFLIHTFGDCSVNIQEYMTYLFLKKSTTEIKNDVIKVVFKQLKSQGVLNHLITALENQLLKETFSKMYCNLSDEDKDLIQKNRNSQFRFVSKKISNLLGDQQAIVSNSTTVQDQNSKERISDLKEKFDEVSRKISSVYVVSYIFSILQSDEDKKCFIDVLAKFGNENINGFIRSKTFDSCSEDIKKHIIKHLYSTDKIKSFMTKHFALCTQETQDYIMKTFFPVDEKFHYKYNPQDVNDLNLQELENLILADYLKQQKVSERFEEVPDLKTEDLWKYFIKSNSEALQHGFISAIKHYKNSYEFMVVLFNKSSETIQDHIINVLKVDFDDRSKEANKHSFLCNVFKGQSLKIQEKLIDLFELFPYTKGGINDPKSKIQLFFILLDNCPQELYDKLEKTIKSINIAMYEMIAEDKLNDYRKKQGTRPKAIIPTTKEYIPAWQQYINEKGIDATREFLIAKKI